MSKRFLYENENENENKHEFKTYVFKRLKVDCIHDNSKKRKDCISKCNEFNKRFKKIYCLVHEKKYICDIYECDGKSDNIDSIKNNMSYIN